MKYLSDKEKKRIIRQSIKKELGLNSRDVGVRGRTGGISSSINILIKSAEALKHRDNILKIANGQQSIDRDQFGEILSGGNTYVFVEVEKSAYQSKIEDATEMLKKLVKNEGQRVTKNGIEYVIPTGQKYNKSVWISENENKIPVRIDLYKGFKINNPTIHILAQYLIRS